ncbi:MATE family efflux transporter [Stenotrophomonas maltophilia]|uniref:MATE family efflux transporter n=1 Tax=Stenotrophomonas maltophilia TaxID=40324 RepID=UPI003CFC138F
MDTPAHPIPPVAPPLWRTYLTLLLPMLLTNALQLAAGTLDNIYLGHLLGTQAVAAAAAFFPVFFLLLALVMGLATGAMVLIGQAWGAGRPQQARAVAGSAVALILLLSVLVMAVGGGFAPQLLAALGTPAPILGESIVYARVLLLAAPAFFLLWLATAVSRAVGDAKTPLHALLLATVVGLLCTPLLILGWAGLPQLGSASAAVSAAFASLLALGWLLWRWHRVGHPLAPGRELLHAIRFDGALIRAMLRIGVPSSLQMLSLAIAEIVLLGLGWINRYGYTATAAYGAVNQLMSWVQLPAMSLGITATILAAHAMGAGRTARLPAIARTGVMLGLAMLTVVVLLVMALAPWLTGLILAAAEPRELATQQLRTVVWGVLAMGGSAVLVGVMRGSGTVLLPALLGMAAVLQPASGRRYHSDGSHPARMQVFCFARWRPGAGWVVPAAGRQSAMDGAAGQRPALPLGRIASAADTGVLFCSLAAGCRPALPLQCRCASSRWKCFSRVWPSLPAADSRRRMAGCA